MNAKIEIENLDLHYGRFHALKAVGMAIRERRITALIGPSGCGKSTLLRCLNRMNDLIPGCRVRGSVRLDGRDILGPGVRVDELRKRVHRQAAVELGVPPFLAFRVKDPAQSGSGIHQIIETIARTQNVALDKELVTENIKIDKGSLYRYGRGVYGEEASRDYIQRLHREIQNSYKPAILE